MAEPVRVGRLTDREGQKLQQIVRWGSISSVRCRWAMMLLASVGGNRVPVVAQLVQADEDTRTSLSRLSNSDVGLLRRNRARTVLGLFPHDGCVSIFSGQVVRCL